MALTIEELRDEVANHLQDPAHLLLNRQQLLEFINSAAWDASNGEWLLPVDDETIETSSGVYEYNIPTTPAFTYIHEVWLESGTANQYDTRIVRNQWSMRLVSTTAVLHLDPEMHVITVTRNLKLVGHTRPTVEYSEDTDNVDGGLESFLRERAVAYGARNLARGGGQQAVQYAQLAADSLQASADMLVNRPEQFQLHQFSRPVPGR